MTTLSSLSPDALRKVALDLTWDEISKLCTTSKKFKPLCEDRYFWIDKIITDFKVQRSDLTSLSLNKLKATYLDLLVDVIGNDILKADKEFQQATPGMYIQDPDKSEWYFFQDEHVRKQDNRIRKIHLYKQLMRKYDPFVPRKEYIEIRNADEIIGKRIFLQSWNGLVRDARGTGFFSSLPFLDPDIIYGLYSSTSSIPYLLILREHDNDLAYDFIPGPFDNFAIKEIQSFLGKPIKQIRNEYKGFPY